MGDTAGFQEPRTTSSEYTAHDFFVRSIINKLWVMTLVEVKSCTNKGGLSPEGFVDVLPLVNQIDPNGQPIPHDVIHHLLYFRFHGGTNGIICDPSPGDRGLAIFAHHDTSNVKANGGVQANPGSRRRNDPADGVFLCGVLNGIPTQYVLMNADGLTLVSPIKVQVQAPEIDMNATGAIKLTSTTLTHNGVDVGSDHMHTLVTVGESDSGPPVGGTA